MNQAFDYKGYWEQTYQAGETSGRGSYGVLAEFKAEVVNGLIQRENIASIIEFGCGDGRMKPIFAQRSTTSCTLRQSG